MPQCVRSTDTSLRVNKHGWNSIHHYEWAALDYALYAVAMYNIANFGPGLRLAQSGTLTRFPFYVEAGVRDVLSGVGLQRMFGSESRLNIGRRGGRREA